MNKTNVVIFIIIDDKKILVEKRFLQSLGKEHYLIPGGRVKLHSEDLEDALQRELMEELGIKPINFTSIPTEEEIFGIKGQLLNLFLIHSWEGNLPDTILDKGTPLLWLDIEEVANSPFEPTRKIIKALESYLLKQQ